MSWTRLLEWRGAQTGGMVLAALQSIVILALALQAPATNLIDRYDIRVALSLERGTVDAEARIAIVAPEEGLERIEFQLNRGFDLKEVSSPVGIRSFTFDTARVGEYRYSPQGAVLEVVFDRALEAREHAALLVRYGGVLSPDVTGLNLISRERTELALYCSWFPHHTGSRRFLFDLRVETEPGYVIAANGDVRGGDGTWEVHNEMGTSDINLFTVRGMALKAASGDGREFRFYYRDVPEAVIDTLAAAGQLILNRYAQWFGSSGARRVTVVLSDRLWGGSYGRLGYLVMQYSYFARSGRLDYRELVRGLAHEAAHMW